MPKRNSRDSLNFWDKIKYLFSDPNFFFQNIKSEEGIKNSLLMYVTVALFFSIVSYVFFLIMNITLLKTYGDFFKLFFFVTLILWAIMFFIGIIMTFVYSLLIHVIMIAFYKSEVKYKNSYNVYTYSMIPSHILGAIPFIGFLSIIYSFVLMIIGISITHNVSKGKAALACLLPLLIIILFTIGLLITFIMSYISSFQAGIME